MKDLGSELDGNKANKARAVFGMRHNSNNNNKLRLDCRKYWEIAARYFATSMGISICCLHK